MKNLMTAIILTLFVSACNKGLYQPVTFHEVEVINLDEVEQHITLQEPQDIINRGNLTIHNDYVYLVEQERGIHIIDNSDPMNPIKVNFLQMPMVVNVSLVGDYLYTNVGPHLIVMKLVQNVPELVRVEKYALVTDKEEYNINGSYEIFLITGNTIEIGKGQDYYDYQRFTRNGKEYLNFQYDFEQFRGDRGIWLSSDKATSTGNSAPNNVSTSGSFASFSVTPTRLYAIVQFGIIVYDIESREQPKRINFVPLSWNLETLYPYKDYLFVGTTDGLVILDRSDDSNLRHIANFSHATACDPVVATDKRAYVTLRSDDRRCSGFTNELDIVNIEDISNPYLESQYEMASPKGLSISYESKYLYICDANHVVIFDTHNETGTDIKEVGKIAIDDPYDVIVISDNHILVNNKNGLYQYDCSDLNNIQQLSEIK